MTNTNTATLRERVLEASRNGGWFFPTLEEQDEIKAMEPFTVEELRKGNEWYFPATVEEASQLGREYAKAIEAHKRATGAA